MPGKKRPSGKGAPRKESKSGPTHTGARASGDIALEVCPDPQHPRPCKPAEAIIALLRKDRMPHFLESFFEPDADPAKGGSCRDVSMALLADLYALGIRDGWSWVAGLVHPDDKEPYVHAWVESDQWVIDTAHPKTLLIEQRMFYEMLRPDVEEKRSMKDAATELVEGRFPRFDILPPDEQSPLPEGVDMRWHYTVGKHLVSILEDGCIKLATYGIGPHERPVAWFSTVPGWEPSASKRMKYPDGTTIDLTDRKTHELCGGWARIGVLPEVAPLSWEELKEQSGIKPQDARRLVDLARRRGANPKNWFGTFQRVPRTRWSRVQVYRNGHWVDVRFT